MDVSVARAASATIVVQGVVEHGDQRGRLLGFPTANMPLSFDDGLVVAGVYAGHATLDDGRRIPAAISVGRRPTFYAEQGFMLLEAHLLDFAEDLYDRTITVEMVARLRDQVAFDGPDALAAQLRTDVDRCRDVLTRFA